MKPEFTVAHQYNLYLERMGLKEEDMHPVQQEQLKQAFYGAWSQFLFLNMEIVEFHNPKEVYNQMLRELEDYWSVYKV